MKVNVEKSKAQMRRGILEFCILNIIDSNEMYPSDIIKELGKANLLVVEGTMYPLLTRLKNAGILTYRWKESRSGPPRKYYRLSDKGIRFRNELQKTWEQLVAAVEQTITNGTTNN